MFETGACVLQANYCLKSDDRSPITLNETNRIVVKIGREFSLTSKLPKAFNGICTTNGRIKELTDGQSYCNVTFMTGVRKCFVSKILKQTFQFFSQNFPSLSKYYLY